MLEILGPIIGGVSGIAAGVVFYLLQRRTEQRRSKQRESIIKLLDKLTTTPAAGSNRALATERAVRMVLQLHKESPSDKGYCSECDESYPCETVSLIQAATKGTGK